nr:uncharacterized protein LOC110376364 isoform X2 [Helicoverpa armigera]
MFKRHTKGIQHTPFKPKKWTWMKNIFTRKPKTLACRRWIKRRGQLEPRFKHSVISLFRSNMNQSKLNIRDIELIDGMDANDLKKRFSVSGANAKILEEMVADYKDGRLSLAGMSHKSKFNDKWLDKTRLNRMIKEYDEVRRKKDLEDILDNARQLKKKFSLTKSEACNLDKVMKELNNGKGSKLELVQTLFDPNRLTKDRVQDIVKQYREGKKKKRGLSYLASNLSFVVASKQRVHTLMSELSWRLKTLNR